MKLLPDLLTFTGIFCLLSGAQASAQDVPSATSSLRLMEARIEQTEIENRDLRVENTSLENTMSSLTGVRDSLKAAQPALSGASGKSADAIKALATYKKTVTPPDPAPTPAPRPTIAPDLKALLTKVEKSFLECSRIIGEALKQFEDLSVLSPKTEDNPIKSALRGFRSNSRFSEEGNFEVVHAHSSIRELWEEISYNSAPEIDYPTLAAAIPVESIEKLWKDAFEAQRLEMLRKIEKLESALRARIGAVKSALKTGEERVAETEKNITLLRQKAAEDAGKKASEENATKDKLSLALYMMVGVLGVALFMLLWFSLRRPETSELGKLIIESRLLIEVLSMGFLLLSIVILGTSKMLASEGLAAILGTTAGYIFGRNQGDKTKGTTGIQ